MRKQDIAHIIYAICAIFILFSGTMLLADFSKAFSLYAQQNYDPARNEFLEVVKTEPDNARAWFYLGEIEKAQKQYDKAANYYMRAIEGSLAGKNLSSAYLSLMMITQQQHNYQLMVRACRIYWQKSGNDEPRKRIETLTNRALWSKSETAVAAYNDGLALLRTGKTEDAALSFYKAMQLDASFLAPRFEMGMIAYRRGDNDTALQHISIVADKIFYYTSAQMVAARLYEEKSNYQRAITHYTNVLEYGFIPANDRFENLRSRAQCNLRADRLGNASDDIEAALAIKQTQSARLIQVAILIRNKQYQKADEVLQREAAKDPSNPEILYQQGSLQYLQNNPSHVETFAKLFSLYSDKLTKDIPVKYHRTFQIIARAYYQQKRYDGATAVFKKIPDNMMNYEDKSAYARALFHTRNFHEAQSRLEKLSLSADDRLMLIKCYRQTGNETKAYSMLKPIVLGSQDRTLDTDPDLATLVTKIRYDEAERLRIEAEERARKEKERADAAAAAAAEQDSNGTDGSHE